MSEISAAQLLSQLNSMAAAAGNGAPGQNGVQDQVKFSELLLKAVDHVNGSQQHVRELREGFQRGGENIDISQVMIASQKANVEFQLMMQARNRLISAYQDIMSMQI